MSVEFQKNGTAYVTVRAKGDRRVLWTNDSRPKLPRHSNGALVFVIAQSEKKN